MTPAVILTAVASVAVLTYLVFRKPAVRPVSSYSRIFVVGDSIAQGLAAHVPSSLRGLSVTHVGAQMPTVQAEVYSDLRDAALSSDDLILVNVGTNDSYANLGRDEMQERVRSFLGILELIAPDAGKLWALPPAAGQSSRYDNLRLSLAYSGATTTEMADATSFLAPDGIHLTPAGYEEYVRQILEA